VQILETESITPDTPRTTGLAGFCQKVEKTFFSMVKTGLSKILFAGKNRFKPEVSSK